MPRNEPRSRMNHLPGFDRNSRFMNSMAMLYNPRFHYVSGNHCTIWKRRKEKRNALFSRDKNTVILFSMARLFFYSANGISMCEHWLLSVISDPLQSRRSLISEHLELTKWSQWLPEILFLKSVVAKTLASQIDLIPPFINSSI